MNGRRKRPVRAATLLAGAVLAAGCATLQQMAALRQVDFTLDGVSGATLAGVSIDQVQSPEGLSATDVARVGAALVGGSLPLEFRLHIGALNPPDNDVPARLLELDWELLVEDRQTIAGRLAEEYVLEPGVPEDVPLDIQLDLAEFFEHDAQNMLELALAVAGAGGEPKSVAVRATPTIQTSLGPIRYPSPITIAGGEPGGE